MAVQSHPQEECGNMRNKESRVCFVMALGVVLVAPGLFFAPNVAGDPVTWTFALYVNGDNNLEDEWDGTSLPLLLNIPANSEVDIVAMVDLKSTEGTDLVEISGGSWQVVDSYPEMNFGDGATLEWFITQVATLYPSDKLSITIWDHGFGWIEFSFDESSWDRIHMPEMTAAIQGAGVYIDILSFDACNMGNIEVVYEAYKTGLVGYMVGSEESVPFDGYPYDFMWTLAALDPSRTPAQVAVDMVDGWGQYYDETSFTTVNLAAVDVSSIGASAPAFETWCGLMHGNLGAYAKVYSTALKNAYVAWSTKYFVDMADLGETLLADSKFSNAALRSATATMVAAIDDAVLAVHTCSALPDARGLTLWWGSKGSWSYYGPSYIDTQWGVDMGWYDFLVDYN
ncbi:MAG: clostripain-related cysteine peptidase [Thermoplasmata archaeon]|nr:clostripain-related cysteine peptidase [Thermoplasmata archaeon]